MNGEKRLCAAVMIKGSGSGDLCRAGKLTLGEPLKTTVCLWRRFYSATVQVLHGVICRSALAISGLFTHGTWVGVDVAYGEGFSHIWPARPIVNMPP